MTLNGAVALVTGAGRGIGMAIAETLARAGATVVLVSRTQEQLEAVRHSILREGGDALVHSADISNEGDVENLFSAVKAQFGRLDILVNNAGVGYFSPVRELSVREFDTMWNVNMRGVFLCSQQAVRIMETQQSGIIVNISSLAGKNAFVNGAGYAATKWALIGFARCLMLEVRERNIRVVTVCPGSVNTSFTHPVDATRAEKIIHPQDVADVVLNTITMPARTMVSEIDLRPTNPK